MFGSQIIDVGIGLITLFLLLSLICSSIKEGLETFLRYRSKDLERGIKEILDDPKMLPTFYDHPVINALFKGKYSEAKKLGNLPSYIPSQTFAVAVLDMYKTLPETAPLRKAITPLLESAGTDFRRAQANVEDWFNAAMDRVSGWYKRRTQIIIAGLALCIAVSLNVDTIAVARYLSVTPDARKELIQQASKLTPSDAGAVDKFQTAVSLTDIPIGWTLQQSDVTRRIAWRALPVDLWGWLLKVAGLIATALAISLGAPFWFDVLNKIMVIRSTVKPEEKSRDEPSKA
jgi:hypothetical protein